MKYTHQTCGPITQIWNKDVKRGQKLKAEAEAKAKTEAEAMSSRLKSRPDAIVQNEYKMKSHSVRLAVIFL